MKVLIVEDSKTIGAFMRKAVEEQGHETRLEEDGALGLAAFSEYQPDLVISDVEMPNMNGIQLLKAIRKRSKETYVVIFTAAESEEYAIQALHFGANNFIRKPVHLPELIHLLGQYEDLLKARKAIRDIVGNIEKLNYQIKFENRVKMVPKYADYLLRECDKVLNEEQLFNASIGLIEVLMNAIEHGNLNITFEEKSKALEEGAEKLNSLYEKRRLLPDHINRRVKVEYSMDIKEGFCEWSIQDEGNGFNFEEYIKKAESSSTDPGLGLYHGRGILISTIQFDEMEYSDKGRKVRLRIDGKK